MNFMQWCDQIARDTDSKIGRELVKEVMQTAIKVAIVELMTNKDSASLDIHSVGKFYLNKTKVHSPVVKMKRTDGKESTFRWVVHFKPSRVLKELFNDDIKFEDFYFVKNYLTYSDGDVIRKKSTRVPKKIEVKSSVKKEFKDSLKKQIKAKLPED